MKKYDIISILLLIYLAVMAYFGRGMLTAGNYFEYFTIIIVTVVVIILLRWSLKRKEALKQAKERQEPRNPESEEK